MPYSSIPVLSAPSASAVDYGSSASAISFPSRRNSRFTFASNTKTSNTSFILSGTKRDLSLWTGVNAKVEDQISYFHASFPDSYIPTDVLTECISQPVSYDAQSFTLPCIGNCLHFSQSGNVTTLLYPYGENLCGLQSTTISTMNGTVKRTQEKHLFRLKSPIRGIHASQVSGRSRGNVASPLVCITSFYSAWLFQEPSLFPEKNQTRAVFQPVDFVNTPACITDCAVSPFIANEVLLCDDEGCATLWLDGRLQKLTLPDTKTEKGATKARFGAEPRVILYSCGSSVHLCDTRAKGVSTRLVSPRDPVCQLTFIEQDPCDSYRFAFGTSEEVGYMDYRMPLHPFASRLHHQEEHPPLWGSFASPVSDKCSFLVTSNCVGGEIIGYPINEETADDSLDAISMRGPYGLNRTSENTIKLSPNLASQPLLLISGLDEDKVGPYKKNNACKQLESAVIGHCFISDDVAGSSIVAVNLSGKLMYKNLDSTLTVADTRNSLDATVEHSEDRGEASRKETFSITDMSFIGDKVLDERLKIDRYPMKLVQDKRVCEAYNGKGKEAKSSAGAWTCRETRPRTLDELKAQTGEIGVESDNFTAPTREISFYDSYLNPGDRRNAIQQVQTLLQWSSVVHLPEFELCPLPSSYKDESLRQRALEQEGQYSTGAFLYEEWKKSREEGSRSATDTPSRSRRDESKLPSSSLPPVLSRRREGLAQGASSSRSTTSPDRKQVGGPSKVTLQSSPASRKSKSKKKRRVEGF